MAGLDAELVIVDNDSADGSFEALSKGVAARGWTGVRVLQSGQNGGFGAGNNFGIRAGCSDGGTAEYVYILNPDAFPDAGAIGALVAYLDQNPCVGFAGSYIHGGDGAAHVTAFRFPSIASEFEGAARIGPISRLLTRAAVPLPLPEQSRAVDWLAGASLMMRMRVLEQIGLFDEGFFLYFEETDLCRRAKRAGWPTHYVRESSVTHIGSVSTGMKDWQRVPGYWFESRWYYFTKNHGRVYAVLATLAHLAGGVLHRARAAVQRKPVGDPPHFLRDLLRHDLKALVRGQRAAKAVQRRVAPVEGS
jgi:GT2 family glycosyltransferase